MDFINKPIKNIPSCRDLRKLNLKLEKNKKNEERASKIGDKYAEALDTIIKKNSRYQTVQLVNDYKAFKEEREELKSGSYYNYTEKNTFVDTLLHLIEWFNDFQTKITFKTIEKMIETLRFENHSKYFIKNIIENPFDLIQIQHSPINFNQAYRISTELNIPITDELLVEKWAIYAVQDNNGSFYKIKSQPNSQNKYKENTDRCYRQGWYWLLRKFCDENKLLGKYSTLLNILNEKLVMHKKIKHLYGIKDFVKIEKDIGDELLDMYYDETDEIDNDEFNQFIANFEKTKSTDVKAFKLNDEQISAVKGAITDKISIITGPPGTGKTTITEAVIEWFNSRKSETEFEYNISLMAPTGKAFKGLKDKCTNIKNKDICGTLHKCLLNTFPKIQKQLDEKNTESADSKTKIYPEYINKIIVDESSMIDIFMFKQLLKWCKYFDCGIILCGDIKQLPPIGKGRPFECIINSQLFNNQFLKEIKRQDSGKLKECIIKINKHELSIDDFDGESTVFIEHDFMRKGKTVKICKELVNKYGKENIAFITPENNKECGVFEMNKLMQNDVYNATNAYVHGYFKENDYVMRTENKYGDDIIRVNGDTGKIVFKESTVLNPKTGRARKENMAMVIYDEDSENNIEEVPLIDIKDNFTLNYCNTVHKYQGSQKDVIVFIASPIHNSLSWGTNRLKLAYTAISRAAKNLIILGDKKTFFDIQKCKDEPFVSSFMTEFNDYDFE